MVSRASLSLPSRSASSFFCCRLRGGLLEGRLRQGQVLLRLVELTARRLELRLHRGRQVTLGLLRVLLRLLCSGFGHGDLRFALRDDGEIDGMLVVRIVAVAPGQLGFLQGQVGLVHVGRIELESDASLGPGVVRAGVDEGLGSRDFASAGDDARGGEKGHEDSAAHH